MKGKRIFTSTLVASLLLVACGQSNVNVGTEVDADFATATYPIKTDVTLQVWCGLGLGDGSDPKDLPFTKLYKEMTGVTVDFFVPSTDAAQRKEQFNLLLASGDLPDIIEWAWFTIPGGPDDGIKNKYILPLNDLIDQYSPNLKQYLSERPDIDRDLKTDNGNYFIYPFIREEDETRVFNGPMLRQDWLTELNLQIPETIDEWYTVLKAFKEKKGATAPFTILDNFFDTTAFLGAYGISRGFFVDNGTIKYGQLEPAFKDYLATMNKWFEEGLLDSNFSLLDSSTLDSNMTSGKSGATVYAIGGGMGKWLGLMKDSDPTYDLVGAPYPVLRKGDTLKLSGKDRVVNGTGAAITPNCKYPILAARLLDYGYSEEGHMMFNFGSEGVTYNMVDGFPKYTEYITENPEGLSMSQAMSKTMRGNTVGPFVQDKRYIQQYAALPQQQGAIAQWMKAERIANMPYIAHTPEESKEMSKINGDVDTYVKEWTARFIMGKEPLSKFDEYIQGLKALKIDRMIELSQAGYDRYIAR